MKINAITLLVFLLSIQLVAGQNAQSAESNEETPVIQPTENIVTWVLMIIAPALVVSFECLTQPPGEALGNIATAGTIIVVGLASIFTLATATHYISAVYNEITSVFENG